MIVIFLSFLLALNSGMPDISLPPPFLKAVLLYKLSVFLICQHDFGFLVDISHGEYPWTLLRKIQVLVVLMLEQMQRLLGNLRNLLLHLDRLD